jgi:molybdopterin-guanine dinucleotide biosynthesis protein A
MILGAVLAGGRATRFGSDKAMAQLGGRTLLDRAVEALGSECDHVIVVGRERAPVPTLPDWPKAGMGPLGGIAAALRFANEAGYDAVLTCGVDSVGLPPDLLGILAPASAYLAQQPVVGFWPACAAPVVCAILESEDRHSMFAFAERIGARAVNPARNPANINTPADLAAAESHDGL